MPQYPKWTEEEFDILMRAGQISADDLLPQLPRRTVGGINTVRNGVHTYHRTRGVAVLSELQQAYLERYRGARSCPRCGAPI